LTQTKLQGLQFQDEGKNKEESSAFSTCFSLRNLIFTAGGVCRSEACGKGREERKEYGLIRKQLFF
jgi:hypothetical protein